jgi:RNA polymerase sigma-70 factor (ECF subfamily)
VNSLSDKPTILRLQGGDLEALGELYDRHRQMVYRTALAITHDEDAAADLLQDVFLRLYRFANRVDAARPLEPWLYRVTTNLAYTFIGRQKRWWRAMKDIAERLKGEPDQNSEKIAERKEEFGWVQRAIASLSVQHRIVIVLYYVNNQSIKEIADILDIPVGTVKSRLYYGRQSLKMKLGTMGELTPGISYEFS